MIKSRVHAFSLIELLVSIGVIALLCAIVVPSWRVYYRRMEMLSVAHQVAHYIREAQQNAKDQQCFWYWAGTYGENPNFMAKNDGYGHIQCTVKSNFGYNYGNERISDHKSQVYTIGHGNVYISDNPTTFSKTGTQKVLFTPLGAPFAGRTQNNAIISEKVFYVVAPGCGSVAVIIMSNGRVAVGDAEKYRTYGR